MYLKDWPLMTSPALPKNAITNDETQKDKFEEVQQQNRSFFTGSHHRKSDWLLHPAVLQSLKVGSGLQ